MCLRGSRRLSIRKFRVSGSCGAGAVVYSEYMRVLRPCGGTKLGKSKPGFLSRIRVSAQGVL